jgi:hypothetical protein
MRGFMTIGLLVAVGCGTEGVGVAPGALQGADELGQTLRAVQPPPVVFGCSDVVVVASNTANTRALIVSVLDGLAEDAARTGLPVSATYTLPHPDVQIVAQWGHDVTDLRCTDVGMPVVIDGEAPAVSGTLTIDVVPDGVYLPWDHSGEATLWLEDVVLENQATGDQRTLTTLELAGVGVGWYPG